MTKPKTLLVRLQPYNKKRGRLVLNYTYRGVRFTNRWKEVSPAIADELRTLVQPHAPDEEIPLFEIKSHEDAEAVERAERDGALGIAKATQAERVPDKAFRNDKPAVDEETGEISDDVEPGETVEKEPAPAPSLRGSGRARGRQ